MRTIWKYPLPDRRNELQLPSGAEVKMVGIDPANGRPAMWALVNTEAERERRVFFVLGTGVLVDGNGIYVGSTIAGAFVWHIWEHGGARG